MKIALVTAGNLWFSPYVRIYTNYLDELSIDYDIISWNRDGNDKKEGIQYMRKQELSANFISKYFAFRKYALFIMKTIEENKYDKLIVFNPQIAIFITRLLKKYKGKYIFDYRDLSIEQYPIFKSKFKKVLSSSYVNFISSPGFKKALPYGFEYHICHNFDYNSVSQALEVPIEGSWKFSTIKEILTIGGLRDYDSNIEVINALANNNKYHLKFIGGGVAEQPLKDYCLSNKIKNSEFTGYYLKENEPRYLKESTFINIYYPRKKSHNTALSNRFYHSLIYKKPMIVTKDTTQGDFAEQYNLGVSIASCDNLDDQLNAFLQSDYKEYAKRCNEVLREFINEQNEFKKIVSSFVCK